VASGTDVLPAALTGTLFSHIAKLAVGRKPSEVLKAVRMTEREREVFDLIADGLSNKEIGQRLHLATNTVKGHVHNILEKLALNTRLQISAFARSGGQSESGSPRSEPIPPIGPVPPPRRVGPFSLRRTYNSLQENAHFRPIL
jgi:DNA-binding CsgD family transcriptional regulator